MVKNQENYILNTLKSISTICDSIIVVDTGSTDNTVNCIKRHYPSVVLKYLDWQENYGLMRNLCLDFVKDNSWVLFIDSDEEILSEINYYEIHNFLYYLDVNYPNQDKVCTVKQLHHGRPSFFRAERFIKNTKTLSYYGYVHEEPRSTNNKGLIKLDLNFEFTNLGTINSEVVKFNKERRYAELLLKNISQEPSNPRWVSLLTPSMVVNKYIEYNQYIYLLKKNILIDINKEISFENLKNGIYLSYLLERYCLELIKNGEDEMASSYIEFSKILFPHNSNFIVFELSLFFKKIEHECYNKVNDIVNFINNNDSVSIHESSEGSEEGLSGGIVRLLYILSRYDEANEIYSTISDNLVKKMLSEEISLLQ